MFISISKGGLKIGVHRSGQASAEPRSLVFVLGYRVVVRRSFDDLGNEIKTVLRRRGQSLPFISPLFLGDFVLAQRLGHVQGMSHRHDSFGIDGIHALPRDPGYRKDHRRSSAHRPRRRELGPVGPHPTHRFGEIGIDRAPSNQAVIKSFSASSGYSKRLPRGGRRYRDRSHRLGPAGYFTDSRACRSLRPIDTGAGDFHESPPLSPGISSTWSRPEDQDPRAHRMQTLQGIVESFLAPKRKRRRARASAPKA